MTSDIPIKYVNGTSNVDFEVVVFTKNFSTKTPEIYYTAWQILRGQSSVQFIYPASLSVGAIYTDGGQIITAGPFPAKLGSTWEISQENPEATALLQMKEGVPRNPNNAIIIQNVQPSSWDGRTFDIAVYKQGRILVTQPDIHVGNQVDFMLTPKLFFGVVRNMKVGETFKSLEITSFLTEFDLSQYINGVKITLKELGGGKYIFSAESMI